MSDPVKCPISAAEERAKRHKKNNKRPDEEEDSEKEQPREKASVNIKPFVETSHNLKQMVLVLRMLEAVMPDADELQPSALLIRTLEESAVLIDDYIVAVARSSNGK